MITERHVQAIWYDQALRPTQLYATGRNGTPEIGVQVVHPGTWNLGAGPDFLGAVLEVGPCRRRVTGDVEVHLSPADWSGHRHGSDAAYRNIVAHVTWRAGPVPATLPPGALSIVIGGLFASDPGFAPEAIDLSSYPLARLPAEERPCHLAYKEDGARTLALLVEAGRRRLARKARRLKEMMDAGESREQLFYSEIMGALGYTANAQAFRQIAAAVPYRCLRAEPETADKALVAASSFAGTKWNGRPGNAPEVRLRAAAKLFLETGVMALAEADDFSPAACRRHQAEITSARCVGRGRAAAILANIVVPWAIAAGRIDGAPEWMPPEDVPNVVRLVASRVLGRDHNPAVCYAANGVAIQGVIEVGRGMCGRLHPDCRGCALGR